MKKIINYIKEDYKFLLLCILIIFIGLYRLPYNLYTGGGIIDISDRVTVSDGYTSKGSFNMAYVNEVQATIPTYLLSYIFSWDREKVSDSLIDEYDTTDDLWEREKIYMNDANTSALISAFTLANEKVNITNIKLIVLYISPKAKTDLEIGDVILSFDNQKINSQDELIKVVQTHKEGDNIVVHVLRDNKEIDCNVKIVTIDNKLKAGLSLSVDYEYQTERKIEFDFGNNEAGPSGGLMISLEIYNKLVQEDLTKGYIIAGTGTIDKDGKVGTIGGIKYKLKGAVNDKAKVFFVPTGNYEEAIKYKNENNYQIEIVKVDTLTDAVNYLREMK